MKLLTFFLSYILVLPLKIAAQQKITLNNVTYFHDRRIKIDNQFLNTELDFTVDTIFIYDCQSSKKIRITVSGYNGSMFETLTSIFEDGVNFSGSTRWPNPIHFSSSWSNFKNRLHFTNVDVTHSSAKNYYSDIMFLNCTVSRLWLMTDTCASLIFESCSFSTDIIGFVSFPIFRATQN